VLLIARIAVLVLAFAPRVARADDPKARCLEAHVAGQLHQRQGALRAARAALLVCARPECPEPVPSHCARWLAEVDRRQPSIVPSALGPDGRDRADVRVLVDGALVAERLDGRAVPVDPGAHRLRFEIPGAPDIERQLVIREGDKERAVAVSFVTAPRLAPWVLAVGGTAGLATGAAFAARGFAQRSELEQCRPHCPSARIDPVRRQFLIADVAAAAGAVALSVAVYLWLHH